MTHLQVRPVDGFSRLMAQTTRTRARMCLLGLSLILLPILGWNTPKTPFFQAKRTKYWKFYVIETTASILTKFGTTIETTKWSSWVVPVGVQQIQDGGQPPFWKKTVKSPYLRHRLIDFDEILHDDAYWALAAEQRLKFLKNWKFKMAAAAILKNRDIHNGLTDLY